MKYLPIIALAFLSNCAYFTNGAFVQDCVSSHLRMLGRIKTEVTPEFYEKVSDECRQNYSSRP